MQLYKSKILVYFIRANIRSFLFDIKLTFIQFFNKYETEIILLLVLGIQD